MEFKLSVVECRDLTNVQSVGKQDPYVVIKYGKTTFRTKTISNGGTKCAWNEEFKFVISQSVVEIKFEVHDENIVKDAFIGSGSIAISKIMSSDQHVEEWIELTRPVSLFNTTRESAGQLFIKLSRVQQMNDISNTYYQSNNSIEHNNAINNPNKNKNNDNIDIKCTIPSLTQPHFLNQTLPTQYQSTTLPPPQYPLPPSYPSQPPQSPQQQQPQQPQPPPQLQPQPYQNNYSTPNLYATTPYPSNSYPPQQQPIYPQSQPLYPPQGYPQQSYPPPSYPPQQYLPQQQSPYLPQYQQSYPSPYPPQYPPPTYPPAYPQQYPPQSQPNYYPPPNY